MFSRFSIIVFLSIVCHLVSIDIKTSSGWTTYLKTIPKEQEISASILFSTVQTYHWSTSMQNNINMNATVSLIEIISGKKIRLDKELLSNLCPLESCFHCNGVGTVHRHHEVDEINSINEKLHSSHNLFTPCPVCGGSGKMLKRSACNIPADFTVDLLVPSGAKPGQQFTYEPFQVGNKNVGQYGSVSLMISDVEMPVGSTIYYDEKNTSYRMPVNITAIMAAEGFVSDHILDAECLPLTINRSEKITFFNSSIKVPFAFLDEYYCNHQNQTTNLTVPHIIYPKDYKVISGIEASLLVDFHIITMEEREKLFLASWNCSLSKQLRPTNTVAVIDISTAASHNDESHNEEDEEEIICEDPENATISFQQERQGAFQHFQQESLLYKRYWNWLQYLAEITQ